MLNFIKILSLAALAVFVLAGCQIESLDEEVLKQSGGEDAADTQSRTADVLACVLTEELLVADMPLSEDTAKSDYEDLSFADWCGENIRNENLQDFVGNSAAWEADETDPLITATSPTGRATRPTLAQGARLELHVLEPEGTLPFIRKIDYADWEGPNGTCHLEMRVYQRDIGKTGTKPLLYLHGGGWRNRTTTLTAAEVIVSHLLDGHTVFMPAYPLNQDTDGPEECRRAAFAEIQESVQGAYEWVERNMTAFGVQQGAKIDLAGHSAGGQLAMWLGTQNRERTGKVLNFYGPVEFAHFLDEIKPGGLYAEGHEYAKRTMSYILGTQDATELERPYSDVVMQNSLTDIIANEGAGALPPFLMIVGNADDTIPVEQALRPCAALGGSPSAEAGEYPCGNNGSRVIIVDDAGHNFDRRCVNGAFPEDMEDHIENPLERYCPAANADNADVRSAVRAAYDWLNE